MYLMLLGYFADLDKSEDGHGQEGNDVSLRLDAQVPQ
jgi:hypothetical protein